MWLDIHFPGRRIPAFSTAVRRKYILKIHWINAKHISEKHQLNIQTKERGNAHEQSSLKRNYGGTIRRKRLQCYAAQAGCSLGKIRAKAEMGTERDWHGLRHGDWDEVRRCAKVYCAFERCGGGVRESGGVMTTVVDERKNGRYEKKQTVDFHPLF